MTRGSLRHGASPARAFLWFAVLAAVVALPLPGHPAPVKPYTCIVLGSLGGDYSKAKAANDAGEVVGVTTFVPGTVTFNRDERAFAWKDANGNNASDPGEMVFLGSLGYNSWANGLNNLGEAVGSSKYSNTVVTDQRAILWDIRRNPPAMTDLNTLLTPGDQAAYTLLGANDINDRRQVAGWAWRNADGAQVAYLLDLSSGLLTDLGPTTQTALGLNGLASPLVVGSGKVSDGFLFDSATSALLSLLPLTSARSVNDHGEVAGVVNGHPAYWKDLNGNGKVEAIDEVIDLDTFGLPSTRGLADAINNSGLVVGNTGGAKRELGYVLQRAFKWQSGTPSSSKADLNELTSAPFVLRHALDVSDTGLIVGYGSKGTLFDPSSIDKAYLLKPNK